VKTQSGYIFRKGDSWFVRYYDDVLVAGAVVRKQRCKRVAAYCDQYRNEKSVRPLADEILRPLNSGKADVRGTMRIVDFIDEVYLPAVKRDLKPSATRNARSLIENHLRARLKNKTLRDFRCVEGQKLLDAIAGSAKTEDVIGADENGRPIYKPLARSSLSRIKAVLSAIFSEARRLGAIDGINPMQGTRIPKCGADSRTTYAYPLAETMRIAELMPAEIRPIILVAGLTGLRKGEIAGLQWGDVDEQKRVLYVRRAIWSHQTLEVKTSASAAPVPLVEPVFSELMRHKQHAGKLAHPTAWIFPNEAGTPPDLGQVAFRKIVPRIELCRTCGRPAKVHKTEGHVFECGDLRWHGWHAFRRGLGTALNELGVDVKTIQAILRHANANITLAHYVKPTTEREELALEKVARAVSALQTNRIQ
jgi:integrase